MKMASQLQILEEERRKLLFQEQNLIAAHNEQMTKLRSQLGDLEDQIFHLKQSQQTEDPPKSDSWQCLCGKMLKGDRKRCGKCLRWRGGKRGRGGNPAMVQRVVSSNDEAEMKPPKRKRGRKSSGDSASTVSIDDEQAAASLISLSLSL